MAGLAGLPKTNGRLITVEFFHSVNRAFLLLKRDGATTTAGNEGAINIWIDDDGAYRGCRMRYMQTMSDIVTPTKAKLKSWLVAELPKVHTLD